MKDDGCERPDRIALDLASRRGAITGGLAAALSWFAPAGAETLPPVLTSGRHQFTLVSPRRMLPSIRLFNLGGGTLDLASPRGQPILLNFRARWCPACRVERVSKGDLETGNRR